MEKKIKNFVYGRRNVIELLKKLSKKKLPTSEWGIKEVLVKKGSGDSLIKEIQQYLPVGIALQRVSGGELDKLLPGVNHQGIVCSRASQLRKFAYQDLVDLKVFLQQRNCGSFLVLDRIQDVGNLGSILRSAECFGFTNILLPEKESAEITDVVERISSGALHYLRIFRVTNLKQALEALKENSYWIIATSDRGEENWNQIPDLTETALIIGNEKDGIKRILLQESDFVYSIPMHGNVSSLNAAVSAAICMDRLQNRL
ncbi:MAG: 23S rRNA (guanosine(2251)-2'-O)-methyltransferase RlmB [Spirochaetota bacterium]